jgi:hypothetical protein
MKNSITFLLIIFIFSVVDLQAQNSDSLVVKPPLMKSKSQIFIAEIKTDEGVKKGILYDANEQEVIILDSAYQKMAIQVSGIKSIVLRRSNALWFGFRTGFVVTEIPVTLLAFALVADSVPGWGLAIFVVGSGFALFVGGTFLLLSAIPSMSIRVDTPQDYIEKLNPLHRLSQVYLIKKNAPKLRMKT